MKYFISYVTKWGGGELVNFRDSICKNICNNSTTYLSCYFFLSIVHNTINGYIYVKSELFALNTMLSVFSFLYVLVVTIPYQFIRYASLRTTNLFMH